MVQTPLNSKQQAQSTSEKDVQQLYECFSDLGRLQQGANLDISPPCILVVGHQTDGKSALIEGLMGFQFNHVGGGTKTRRPIRLEMRYDRDCHEPECSLLNDDKKWEELSLEQLQDFIAQENDLLESQDTFSGEDIVVRMHYVFSPNIKIIDTPGLIVAAPDKPETQKAAEQVEEIVMNRMSNPDYIILCLESQDDWTNSSTRSFVMREEIDPTLHRTVVVSTKLDTRLQQFAVAADARDFISPTEHFKGLKPLSGAPFFTSIPAGRVASDECDWTSNEEFVVAIKAQEQEDIKKLALKMRQPVSIEEQRRIGVSQLKNFLEDTLLQEYIKRLPVIMTTIQKQTEDVGCKLRLVQEQLRLMQDDNLKEQLWDATMLLAECFEKVGKGVAELPPHIADHAGDTLEDEHQEVGEFQCSDIYGSVPAVSAYSDNIKGSHRLYGGAQLRRVKREVREVLKCMKFPEVNETDMLNRSGGMGDVHDGADVSQVAVGYAVSKAANAFQDVLTTQLAKRNAFALKSMLQLSKELALHEASDDSMGGRPRVAGIDLILEKAVEHGEDLINTLSNLAAKRVLEDIRARAEYFTWDGHPPDILEQTMHELVKPEMHVNKHHTDHLGTVLCEGDFDHAASKAIGWVSSLFVGTQQQAATSFIPKLSESIFNTLRDEFERDANVKFNSILYKDAMKEMPKYLQKKMQAEDMQVLLEVDKESAKLQKRQQALLEEQKNVQELHKQFQGIKRLLRQSSVSSALV